MAKKLVANRPITLKKLQNNSEFSKIWKTKTIKTWESKKILVRCFDDDGSNVDLVAVFMGNFEDYESKENKESNWEYHYEQQSDDIQSQGRILTFMYYLNDIEEGGETEFVYQDRLKIKPTTGTLLIWPAGFTHTHRALPILNDEPKYLITGWIMFDKLFDNYFGEKKEYIEKLNKENA